MIYLLTWSAVIYTCPWGLGYAPNAVKDLLCARTDSIESMVFDSTTSEESLRRFILKMNPPHASVWRFENERPKPVKVTWLPHLGG